jgi:hypothetical protein
LIWKRWSSERISFTKVEYEDDGSTQPEYPEEENDDYDVYDEYEERMSTWYKSRKIIKPEPGEFKVKGEEDKPSFVNDFAEGKIQVIVKLANIELTPEKPEYEGGSWHIEGQLVRACSFHSYPRKRDLFSDPFTSRTNVSPHQQSTTTIPKTLPQTPSHSATEGWAICSG